MTKFEFTLHFSTEECLQYYEGRAKFIQVRSKCGKLIQFPADKMREHILRDGVHGHFVMSLDDKNKFISLIRIE